MSGLRLSACVALALAFASPAVWCAGEEPNSDDSPLRKFEKGAHPAPNPQPAEQPSSSGDSEKHHGDDDNWLGDLLGDMLSGLFSSNHSQTPSQAGGSTDGADGTNSTENTGGEDIGTWWSNFEIHTFLDRPTYLTMQRMDSEADDTVRRNDGDVLIPYVRYDFSYHHVSSSISGIDNRIEVGYGVIGILADNYLLNDSAYGTSLSVDRYLLQYRLSINKRGELDMGVGETYLMGANSTQFNTVSLAGRIIVDDHLMFEFRPSWTSAIQDYEGAVAYTGSGWSLKSGYRSMTSPGGTLQGPFIGFALHE